MKLLFFVLFSPSILFAASVKLTNVQATLRLIEKWNHCERSEECAPTYIEAVDDGFCQTPCGYPGLLIHQSELKNFQAAVKLKKNCREAKCAQVQPLRELYCENSKCLVR